MFNFNLQNKAFEELNAEQFKLVYFLNNTLSMVNKTNNTQNNNTIEMYNGYMMDKLGLSERQVQRLIKRLEQLEYITVKRATRKNQPNIITLIFEENNATDCTLSQNNDINDAINCDINCDKNVTLNKNEIKYKNNNNNITTGILEHKDLERIVTKENKKEKNNKKEKLSYQSSMDVKVSEPENKIISFKNMMKENEMSDNGTNVMNAISEQSERQAKENESSGCDKINEMTTSMATHNNINDTDTILQDTQVTNNESLSQPQVNNILPLPTLEEDTDPRITKTIHNIDFSMNAMYKGRYDYGQFSSQYEYFTLQCHNLNMLMGDNKYQLYKKQYITPWWNNTKEYFPNGYEKLLKKPTQWEIDKFKKFYNWMEHAQEEREVASAYQNICALLEHLNSKYGEKTLDVLTNQIIHEISAIKHRNNHVSNYIEKIQAS